MSHAAELRAEPEGARGCRHRNAGAEGYALNGWIPAHPGLPGVSGAEDRARFFKSSGAQFFVLRQRLPLGRCRR